MLTMKDVIREGHPTLALKSKEVELPLTNIDKETLKLMMEFLDNGQDPEICEEYDLRPGVGLAAPQINISKRMVVVNTYDESGDKLYKLLLVNPKIMSHSIMKTYLPGGEGCLSVDREVEGITPRHKKITVKSYFYNPVTEELTLGTIKVSGYISIVIQHEIDHLNGILFVDKLFENIEGAEPVVFPEPEFEEEIIEERDL